MSADLKINYLELPAADFDAVQSFYEKAFNDGKMHGGFYKSERRSLTQSGAALIILYADKLEKTKDTVIASGGEIIQDIFSFPGGRRFHFTDPNGNELAVWSDH